MNALCRRLGLFLPRARVLCFAFLISRLFLPCPAGAAGEPGGDPILSGCEWDYPPYCTVTPDGRAQGFSVELLRAALKAMGRDVTFRTGPWAEIKQALIDGELQTLPVVGRTPEREAYFDFTFPYLTMHGTVVVRRGDSRIHSVADLKGKRVAVVGGENSEEYVRRARLGANVVALPSFEVALRELSAGKHDAVVIQKLVAFQLMKTARIENLEAVGPPIREFTQSFCFAVRKGDRVLLSELNEGLSIVMADGTFRSLHAKWFAGLESAGQAKSRIVVGGDSSYPPYEFLDANGQPAGYNVDLTRAIARQMGLNVDIRLGKWDEIRRGLQQGEIDIVEGMFYSPERDQTFDFSPPHTIVKHAIVSRQGSEDPSSLHDITRHSVVVMRGDVMHDLVLGQHVGKPLVTVDTQEQALRLIAAGEHDVALVAALPALFWIEKNGWHNLHVSRQTMLSAEFCYAVPHGRSDLLASFSEGLAAIKTTGEYREIQARWLAPYEEAGVRSRAVVRYAAGAVLFLSCLLAGFIFWSRSLRNQVAAKTRDLTEKTALLESQSEALRTSERKYRLLHESMTDAYVRTGMDGRIVESNRAFQEMLGYGEDELRHLAYLEITPDRWHGMEAEIVRDQILPRGFSDVYEKEYRRKDGTVFPVELRTFLLKSEAGEAEGMWALVRDITKRREAEKALQLSELRFRTAAESVADVVYEWDLAERIDWIGDVDTLMGYPPNEFPRTLTGFSALMHPDDRPVFLAAVKRHVRDGVPYAVEYRLLRHDGTHAFWTARGRILRDSEGRPVRWVGAITDVTGKKQAEEALRKSEDDFRYVFEHSIIGKSITLPTGEIRVNQAFAKMLGYELRELEGMPWQNITHPEDVEKSRRVIESIMNGERDSVQFTKRYVRRDGTIAWADVSTSVRRDALGRAMYFMTSIVDITDRKHAEEALVRSQKLEALGTLAGGVAHEFNNILFAIRGNATLAASEVPDGHLAKTCLEEIDRSAKRGVRIVKQILSFARPHSTDRTVLSLASVIEEAKTFLKATIPAYIEISARLEASCFPAAIDSVQVHQAIVNLVTNAADAIGNRPGLIRITLEEAVLDENSAQKLTSLSPGRYARLSVVDDGPGMDPETLRRAFDPFFTTKSPDKGTGLGLSIVHGIMKNHEGGVLISSEPGCGTTVSLYFPAATVPAAPLLPATERVQRERCESLLLVDDDEALVYLGQRMLGRLGYKVSGFTDPMAALKEFRLRPNDFDGVITDVSMPKMSGFELARELLTARPDIPVVVTSGYIRSEEEEMALALGVRAVILKPDSVDEMASTLDHVFRNAAKASCKNQESEKV